MKPADMTEIKSRLKEAADASRRNIGKTDDPKARALLETTAEVIIGLETAVEHYEKGAEPSWR